MKTLSTQLFMLLVFFTFSTSASAIGLVWGEGNWGETEWSSAVTESVPPPEGPIPAATKIKGSPGTDAGFTTGAYSSNGTPAYGNSFTDGDFVTIIAEINPDTSDIGTNGDLIVVMLSFIEGKQVWSFLNTDGNFESWNLKLGGLGAAQIAEPLEASHALTIFEGNLAPGAHRLAIGYMADGGPLIYTPKAINILVSE